MNEVEIVVEVISRSAVALEIRSQGIQCWVPRSQILDYTGEEESPESIFLAQEVAEEKGLI